MCMRWWPWQRRTQQAGEPAPSLWGWVGGKRVLRESRYVLPSDAAEEERLNLQHFFYKLAQGGNTRVPLRAPRQILDVACGTGIWPREMAQEYPQTEVWGFDIHPEQLKEAERRFKATGQYPPNFHYGEANALDRFPFEDERFDLTHARLMSTWLPAAQYPQVVAEMLRVTRPGGFIELVDFEVPSTASAATTALMQAAVGLLKARGLHNGGGPFLATYLREAGVARVQERRVVAGVGQHRVREQRLMVADLLAALHNMAPILVKTGMLNESMCSQLLQQAEVELPRVGMTYPIVSAYGIRPLIPVV
jgi:ubiquinone/menaquinone biosynthesis C-methylase UbiE